MFEVTWPERKLTKVGKLRACIKVPLTSKGPLTVCKAGKFTKLTAVPVTVRPLAMPPAIVAKLGKADDSVMVTGAFTSTSCGRLMMLPLLAEVVVTVFVKSLLLLAK